MADQETTLATLKQAQQQEALPQVAVGFSNTHAFELTQRAAKLLASSTLVPTEFRGNMANCAIALNMAGRIGADPLMVMQNLYVVHGRPGWSSQFLIACFNQCGRFSSVKYEFTGEEGKDSWGCRARAIELSSGEEVVGPEVTIKLAKEEGWYSKKGSKWQTIPELMLRYRAAGWMIRTTAPEIGMGLQTAEELHDTVELTNVGNGSFEMKDLGDVAPPAPPAEDAETVEVPAGEPDKIETGRFFPDRVVTRDGVTLATMSDDTVFEVDAEQKKVIAAAINDKAAVEMEWAVAAESGEIVVVNVAPMEVS